MALIVILVPKTLLILIIEGVDIDILVLKLVQEAEDWEESKRAPPLIVRFPPLIASCFAWHHFPTDPDVTSFKTVILK